MARGKGTRGSAGDWMEDPDPIVVTPKGFQGLVPYGDSALDDSFASPVIGLIVLVAFGALYLWLAGGKKRG